MADAGEDEIVDGRDESEGEQSVAHFLRMPEEGVDEGSEGDNDMDDDICGLAETSGHRRGRSEAEDDSCQGDENGEDVVKAV